MSIYHYYLDSVSMKTLKNPDQYNGIHQSTDEINEQLIIHIKQFKNKKLSSLANCVVHIASGKEK